MDFIIAHRGNSAHAPENTLAAFLQVPGTGAKAVELDVHFCADKVAVVLHDEWVDRTTNGQGPVDALSLEGVKALDAGSWFAPAFAGERIPTLMETLNALITTGMWVNIEIKTDVRPQAGLVKAVLNDVVRSSMGNRVLLSGFRHEDVLQAMRLNPGLPCALLFDVGQGAMAPALAQQHGPEGVHLFDGDVTEALVTECHQAGAKVRVYTVDDPERAKLLKTWGVDGIFTNDPALLAKAL